MYTVGVKSKVVVVSFRLYSVSSFLYFDSTSRSFENFGVWLLISVFISFILLFSCIACSDNSESCEMKSSGVLCFFPLFQLYMEYTGVSNMVTLQVSYSLIRSIHLR